MQKMKKKVMEESNQSETKGRDRMWCDLTCHDMS
jgi:hypothetical protein